MENIKVSVVVPIYNVESYIVQCADSIINQTYGNIEILLIDDGSTDSSGAICDEYAEKDARVKAIHKVNGGLSSSRECGISAATGDYIMILDGDDWLDTEAIEECVKRVEANPEIECVMFSYVKEYPESSVITHVLDGDAEFYGDDAEDKIYRRLFGLIGEELAHPERLAGVGSCCMKLYKSELAKRGRYYSTSEVGSAEDALFNMYALHGIKGFAYIDKPYYHYRKTNTSITATYRPRLREQWGRLYDIMGEIIEEKGLSQKYSEALSNYIALNTIGAGLNEFSNKDTGFFGRKKKIKEYLKDERVHGALVRLDTSKMPLKWKAFMLFAKRRCAFMLTVMFSAIGILKKKG